MKFLDAKPKRLQQWWPKEGRKAAWVGVLRGGIGWRLGNGDALDDDEISDAKRLFIRGMIFRERPAS